MPSSKFYGICRWIKNDANEFVKSVEVEVTLASGVTYNDHASEDKVQPEIGDPVMWVVTFPNSDDYATMLAGTAPTLPPSSSDLFTFATRTTGGSAEVCDYDMPVNDTWIGQFMNYLAYWFPTLYAEVQALSLTGSMTRRAIINAVAQAINAAAPRVEA